MANSIYEVLSIHFEFKPDWTEVTVVCGPPSDGMLGVQGKHTKIFPKEVSALDILKGDIAHQNYLVDEDWRQG